MRARSIFLPLAALVVAAGCSHPQGLIVLLPEPDGGVGRLEVRNEAGSQVLTRPWEATELRAPDRAPEAPTLLDEETVREDFGAVLAAEPPAPVHFILYFERDSTTLRPASVALVPEIIAAMRERHSVDTSVVGHTDTAGAKDYNFRLSVQRAAAVAELLRAAGVDEGVLRISSHGEEDLLVKTPDEVHEPRNRRVEVTVR